MNKKATKMDVQFWKNYDSAEEQLYKDSNDETEDRNCELFRIR